MASNQKHNALLAIVIGIIIAIGRIKLTEQNDADIMTIMAVVNVVAFSFVLIMLFNGIYNKVFEKIENSGLSIADANRMKLLIELIFLIVLCTVGILGIKYVTNYRSTTYNDAMSIIALAISISNDGTVEWTYPIIYKFTFLINQFINFLIKKTFLQKYF